MAGAIPKTDYLGIIHQKGFKNVSVQKKKDIRIPDEILAKYLSLDELEEYKNSKIGIFSITVYAEK